MSVATTQLMGVTIIVETPLIILVVAPLLVTVIVVACPKQCLTNFLISKHKRLVFPLMINHTSMIA